MPEIWRINGHRFKESRDRGRNQRRQLEIQAKEDDISREIKNGNRRERKEEKD